MKYKCVQLELDLFPLSGLIIDDALSPDLATWALTHLQSKQARIVYSIIHPDTIEARLSDLSHRDTWNLGEFREINVNKKRMKTFRANSTCKCCGTQGNVYVIEQNVNDATNSKYLNLYSVTAQGAIEMTVDHKLCVSLGGNDLQTNRDAMCRTCNQKKANEMSRAEIVYVLAHLKDHVKSWVNHDFIRAILNLHLLSLTHQASTQRQIKAACGKHLHMLRKQPKDHQWAGATSILVKMADTLTTAPIPSAPEPIVVPSSWFNKVVNHITSRLRKSLGVASSTSDQV